MFFGRAAEAVQVTETKKWKFG